MSGSSLKANLEGTNLNGATDQVLIAKVKSFLSSVVTLTCLARHNVYDWEQLKKRMDLEFHRHWLKYETIHANNMGMNHLRRTMENFGQCVTR